MLEYEIFYDSLAFQKIAPMLSTNEIVDKIRKDPKYQLRVLNAVEDDCGILEKKENGAIRLTHSCWNMSRDKIKPDISFVEPYIKNEKKAFLLVNLKDKKLVFDYGYKKIINVSYLLNSAEHKNQLCIDSHYNTFMLCNYYGIVSALRIRRTIADSLIKGKIELAGVDLICTFLGCEPINFEVKANIDTLVVTKAEEKRNLKTNAFMTYMSTFWKEDNSTNKRHTKSSSKTKVDDSEKILFSKLMTMQPVDLPNSSRSIFVDMDMIIPGVNKITVVNGGLKIVVDDIEQLDETISMLKERFCLGIIDKNSGQYYTSTPTLDKPPKRDTNVLSLPAAPSILTGTTVPAIINNFIKGD